MMGGPRPGPPGGMRPGPPPPADQKIRPGTVRRVVPYALRHRKSLFLLLVLTLATAGVTSANPLILKAIIDDGIQGGHTPVVVRLALLIAALAVLDAGASYAQAWVSARIGQGVVYDLRTRVFDHIQRQPVAFFARSQTGALVSRLNNDVVGAQQATTTLLSQSTDTILKIIFTLATMFYLSWQITVVALVMIPLFLLPAKLIGRVLQRLARRRMHLDAEMGTMMNERFNVAGALLTKLYGQPQQESAEFSSRAGKVRDMAIRAASIGALMGIIVTLLTSFTNAVVYGFGGALVVRGELELGTLVAMATLLARLYGPVNQLSSLHLNFVTALVSFDRVFEVLDLEPSVAERPEARSLNGSYAGGATAPEIEFDQVSFRYPRAGDVSIPSLQLARLGPAERGSDEWILRDLSFRVPAGKLTALVGPSGAGKTTITHLVPRLYDVVSGAVRIDGEDVRDLTLSSLSSHVGVVTQDAHLFHDTLRANLLYARPDATEHDLVEACEAAQIWSTVSALPDGLDTVVGDRGYRLSGGEKQRIALARLLLKSPPIVVLDEATAHLDSASEVAIQRALVTALAGRTSLVIAHRLSTIRKADQILFVEQGQIRERGTHEELLTADGRYARLYRTQFAEQEEEPVG
ncbi:ABC transporter ATP-binding protein [Actinoplanes sp. NPDC049548]|uniref:ABC transporter ATP-binding protein n=1 Tax=Actinoplanes sp. NPDC049548 TaxID=3155152 RepID=UPI003449CFAA